MKPILERTRIAAVLTAAAVVLGGCFDVTQDATVRDDGQASIVVELALAAELAAIVGNPALSKQFGQEGAPNFLSDCGKPWPADKPLPAGVRSIESVRAKRGDMETCTLIIEVPDPVAAVASAREMQPPAGQKLPRQEFSLVRLDGRPGYRLRTTLTPPDLPIPPGADQNIGRALLDAMFANRYMTLSLSARSIENANGELSPDKSRVTWRYPIAAIFDPARDKPLSIEADILYK